MFAELCKEIRKKYPNSIIFAVTAYAGEYNLFEFKKAGFDDFFIKPVDIKQLIDRFVQKIKARTRINQIMNK